MATRAAWRIELEGWLPPAELSPNARVHWRKAHRCKQLVYIHVGAAGLLRGWPRQESGRRRLTITMHRPRLLDTDNAYAICKAVVDAVVREGWLVDDSPRYVDIAVRQVKATGKAWRGTVLELEELEEALAAPDPRAGDGGMRE